jgi:hypothetical protein
MQSRGLPMAYEELYANLEERGFILEEHVSRIAGMRRDEYSELYEMVYTLILVGQGSSQKRKTLAFGGVDPFAFVASSSMRGDTGCTASGCRSKKLDMLARFAALYADAVLLPVPIFNPDVFDYLKKPKSELQKIIFGLLRLRVLITDGLVRPVLMEWRYCKECFESHQRFVDSIREAANDLAEQFMDSFVAHYEVPASSPSRFGHFEVEGPRDFIEHGRVHTIPRNKKVLEEIGISAETSARIELTDGAKRLFVQKTFREFANNAAFYFSAGISKSTRMLTDLPGEGLLLSALNREREVFESARAMNSLIHTIPLIGEMEVATLLRIRKRHEESFIAYRKAIRSIIDDIASDPASVSDDAMRRMLRERIEPEVESMNDKIAAERRRQRRRLAGGAASLAAVVGMGLYGGLPLIAAAALTGIAATTAGKLISKAAESACEHDADIQENNDFYFLLRLSRGA